MPSDQNREWLNSELGEIIAWAQVRGFSKQDIRDALEGNLEVIPD